MENMQSSRLHLHQYHSPASSMQMSNYSKRFALVATCTNEPVVG